MNSHRGYEHARNYQVKKVVDCPPPDLDGEGDVEVGLRAAVVDHLVPDGGHSWAKLAG